MVLKMKWEGEADTGQPFQKILLNFGEKIADSRWGPSLPAGWGRAGCQRSRGGTGKLWF